MTIVAEMPEVLVAFATNEWQTQNKCEGSNLYYKQSNLYMPFVRSLPLLSWLWLGYLSRDSPVVASPFIAPYAFIVIFVVQCKPRELSKSCRRSMIRESVECTTLSISISTDFASLPIVVMQTLRHDGSFAQRQRVHFVR